MNKYALISLALLAAIGVALLNADHVLAMDTASQLNSLKAQFLPAEYRNTNFSVEDIKKVYREKCKKVTGVDNSTLYQEIEKGATVVMNCLSTFANFSTIQEEIEKARPIGELDTVFHKYCSKAPTAEKCIRDFNEKLQPCLTSAERSQNAVLLRIGSGLLNFLCQRGGDHIALFIAEQGPECLEANREAISNCANSSFHEFMPKNGSMPDLLNLPELVLTPEHCVDFERFEQCTLHHLQQCREITPANVVESIFRFVKNETSCKSWMESKASGRSVLKQPGDGAASLTLYSMFTVTLVASLTALLNILH